MSHPTHQPPPPEHSPYYPGGHYAPEPASGNLKQVLGVLRRRKFMILSIVLLVTTLAAIYAYQLTSQFTATAQVVIDPRQLRVVQMEAVAQGLTQDAATIETQIRLIRSRSHAERVAEHLNLMESAAFNPALRRDEGSPLMVVIGRPLTWVRDRLPAEWLIASGLAATVEGEEEEDTRLSHEQQREAVIGRVAGMLSVAQDGRSHLINIGATSTDPRIAARIATATAEIYVRDQLDAKLSVTRQASGWLDERVNELRDHVRETERAIERFRAEHDLIDTRGVTLGDQQLADLNRQLIMTRAERMEKESKLRLARETQARAGGFEALSEVIASPMVQTLRREEAQLLRQHSQLSLEFGERHPRIVQLNAEIDNVREKVADEIQTILSNLENEVAATRSRERSIEESLLEAQGLSAEARQLEVQLRELEREAESSRTLYATFLHRLGETTDQQELVEPDVRLVATASVPRAPSYPNRKLITAGGFTVSLLFGTFLAFLFERLDSGVRSSRQIEQLLGLPTLGFVPRVGGLKSYQKLHHYLLARPLSAYAEAVQSVYTGVQLSDVDQATKVVLVTSSLPGEGKTTLATSLAALAARAGRKTMLVDLDLRHPSVHRELMQPVSAGLVEYLAGECALEDIVAADEVEPELHVLPIYGLTPRPVDLLRSQRLKSLIAGLRSCYDFVVLDTTPLLGLTDPKVAAGLADKVLFAVQWEKTVEDVVVNGFDALQEAGAEIAGVVLTQVDVKRHASYGYGDVAQYYGKYQTYYRN